MIERTRDLLQDANAGREIERAYGLEHALERAAIHPFGGVPQKMVGAAEAGRRHDVRVRAHQAGRGAAGADGEKPGGTEHYGAVKWPLWREPPSCALLATSV